MKHIKKIIVAGVASLALAACGTQQAAQPAQSAQAVQDAQAAQPAGSDQNAQAAPAAAGNDQAAQNPQAGARGPMLMGQVTAINGSTLTVQNPMQQTATNVALNADTKIFKQATINLADAPVGEQVSAVGTLQGDVFVASQIRIGAIGGFGGRGGALPNGQNGQPPQGNPPDGTAPQGDANGQPPQGGPQGDPQGGPRGGPNGGARISGTIEQTSATALTIKQADGTTVQVQLASDGRIVQQVPATTVDITTGASVMVQGDQNGDTVTATRIELVPQMAQPQ